VLLQSSLSIDTSAGNGTVIFGTSPTGTVQSAANQYYSLTINAGTGNTTFNSKIGLDNNTNGIGDFVVSSGRTTFNSNVAANNVTITSPSILLNDSSIVTPGYGMPSLSYGYQTYTGNLSLGANSQMIGNIGYLNGTRLSTGTQSISGYTLATFFNDIQPPTPPNPNPNPNNGGSNGSSFSNDIPNIDVSGTLLNYQLKQNKQAENQTSGQDSMNGSANQLAPESGDGSGMRLGLLGTQEAKEPALSEKYNNDVCSSSNGCVNEP